MENQQLIKKDRSANSYSKIFPWTFTDLVLDRVTKESLDNILVRNNFIALPYVGSKAATRLQVPMKNRRRGIWLSYIDYAGTLTVEYYNDNNLDDNHWQDSSYWLPYNTAEFRPASVGLSALAQEVFDWINSQITAAVELNPEDLQKNSSGQIEEANRAYDTSTFSGLGYRILRKNIQSDKNILTQSMINMPNTVYEIRYDFDLNGNTINIPENCVLKFEGGQLKNGTINFNNCNIDNIGNSIILNNCTLKGSLNKQVIYSDWFYFNSDDCTDTLSNVFKISEGCQLIISEGVYKVSVKNLIGTDYADPMNISILQPQSNSHITINGTIQLIPNDRTHYNIIGIVDKDNILLDGTGEIIGDVETHTGTTGEWGHGVLISGSRNINVKDLRISYCWGDGLSVSYAEKILTDEGLVNSPYSPPEIINITNIKSSYNRRLGISIINGDGIILENSITEGNGTINGTSPKAGLDIEPNLNQSVNNVIVNGCLFYDNVVTYFPSNGLIKDEAISCIIQNSTCKKQVTIGNVGKVIGCEIKYLLINGSRFVNIQNNVITEALALSGKTITGLNVIDNTFLGLTTDGYDSCIRVSCDSFSKVNIASNNFSLRTNSNMRKLVTYTKKQTNAIDIVDSVITYDKTLTLLFYPYANFYNCEFIFSGFNIYNITSELDKYPDSCSFIGCKFAANSSSFYIRDNITDNYKITIENCEYYTKQDNPTDFINFIGHTIALDLVVLNNKGKSVFLKNDIDEAHKRPIINNNYNGHRFYNLTNKRPEYYYNNNWWDSCGYNVNENRNSDGTLIEKVRIVSDRSKIVNSNIRYVIVSDINLQGETLTIPAGCTLDFQGGSFSNGTIVGNNTKIIAGLQKIFDTNVIFSGTWTLEAMYPQWFGAVGNDINDDTMSFKSMFSAFKAMKAKILVPVGIYKITEPITVSYNDGSQVSGKIYAPIIEGVSYIHEFNIGGGTQIKGYNIPNYRGVFEFLGIDNFYASTTSIRNLDITLDYDTCSELSFCLFIGDSRNFNIENVTFKGFNSVLYRSGSYKGAKTYAMIACSFKNVVFATNRYVNGSTITEKNKYGFALAYEGLFKELYPDGNTNPFNYADNISLDSCFIQGCIVHNFVTGVYNNCMWAIPGGYKPIDSNLFLSSLNTGPVDSSTFSCSIGVYFVSGSAVFNAPYFEDVPKCFYINRTTNLTILGIFALGTLNNVPVIGGSNYGCEYIMDTTSVSTPDSAITFIGGQFLKGGTGFSKRAITCSGPGSLKLSGIRGDAISRQDIVITGNCINLIHEPLLRPLIPIELTFKGTIDSDTGQYLPFDGDSTFTGYKVPQDCYITKVELIVKAALISDFKFSNGNVQVVSGGNTFIFLLNTDGMYKGSTVESSGNGQFYRIPNVCNYDYNNQKWSRKNICSKGDTLQVYIKPTHSKLSFIGKEVVMKVTLLDL